MGNAYDYWLRNRHKGTDPHGTAYKRALYGLRKLVSPEFFDSIPITPEADTDSKALYERLAALRDMFPDSFEELKSKARKDVDLPAEKVVKSVRQRRREAGLRDDPLE